MVELCLTQRANPNLQGSKPKSCATGQPYGTVRSVGPVRGGLGYRWLVTPEGLNHIHQGEAGWTIWEAIHAPFLSLKVIYLYIIYYFFSTFFFLLYTLTDGSFKIFNCYFGQICIAARIALCTPVHKSGNGILSLEWECADLEWNISHGERIS